MAYWWMSPADKARAAAALVSGALKGTESGVLPAPFDQGRRARIQQGVDVWLETEEGQAWVEGNPDIAQHLDNWHQLHPETVKPTHNIFDVQNLDEGQLFWLTLLLLGKNNPKSVEKILVTLFESMGKALSHYCSSAAANRITAWGSGRLLSLYMERFGLLTQPQTVAFSDGLTILAGASVAEGFVGLVLPWKFDKDTQYPDTITYGADGSYTVVEGGEETSRSFEIGKAVKEKK